MALTNNRRTTGTSKSLAWLNDVQKIRPPAADTWVQATGCSRWESAMVALNKIAIFSDDILKRYNARFIRSFSAGQSFSTGCLWASGAFRMYANVSSLELLLRKSSKYSIPRRSRSNQGLSVFRLERGALPAMTPWLVGRIANTGLPVSTNRCS